MMARVNMTIDKEVVTGRAGGQRRQTIESCSRQGRYSRRMPMVHTSLASLHGSWVHCHGPGLCSLSLIVCVATDVAAIPYPVS